MQLIKTILCVSALLAVTPNAYAASAMRGCFESEIEAQQFVVNFRSYETSYHETEIKRRKLLTKSGQSLNSLLYALRDTPNVTPEMTLREPNIDKEEAQSEISHYVYHKHLIPSEVRLDEKGQYCSITHSEIHIFRDVWTVDVANNLVLTAKTYTEIAS